MNYDDQFERLEIRLNKYYETDFLKEHQSYKENLSIKNSILDIIISAKSDYDAKSLKLIEYEEILARSLLVLKKNTGCVEDMEILISITKKLKKQKILNDKINDLLEDNACGRWY